MQGEINEIPTFSLCKFNELLFNSVLETYHYMDTIEKVKSQSPEYETHSVPNDKSFV